MQKVALNKSGLEKLVRYLENKIPGIKGQFIISNNRLRLLDEDIEFVVHVPVTEQLDMSLADPSKEAQHLEKPELTTAKPVGKGVDTSVNKIGRAGAKRDEDQVMSSMVDKLSKHFTTRQEFDKFMNTMNTQVKDKGELADAFDQISKFLKGGQV